MVRKHSHQSGSDLGTLPATRLKAVGPCDHFELELVAERGARHELGVSLLEHLLLELGLGNDLHPLLSHAVIGGGQGSELGEVDESLFFAALGGQPSRREGQQGGAEAEEEGGHNLEEEGQLPGPVAADLLGTVGDPEGNNHTRNNGNLLEDQESTTNLRRGNLTNVQGNNTTQPARWSVTCCKFENEEVRTFQCQFHQ